LQFKFEMLQSLQAQFPQQIALSLSNDPTALTNVLNMLSANDTATIKEGERLLKPFLKNPPCIASLINQLTTVVDISVRHHAALLLKKKIGIFFPKFGSNDQANLKSEILQIMIREPIKSVAVAIAGAVAVLTKTIFAKNGQWPEIFTILMQLSHDPNENMRSLNYELLGQLAEQVTKQLKPHAETLATMFVMGCQDAVPAVAKAALAATSSFIVELGNEQEVMVMEKVLGPMVTVMRNCLQSGEEETVVEALDVIQECCFLDQPLVNNHIQTFVEFTLEIIRSKSYESPLQQSAGQTLMNIIENRPKLLAASNLVHPTLVVLMEMIAKEDSSAAGSLFSFSSNKDGVLDDEEEDDGDYSPELDVQRLAQTIIDTMAMAIPSKHFAEPALSLIGQGMSSADPQMRKAGSAVLGVIAEGCADKLRELLPSILPRLLQLMQDPEYYVRECACFALGQFSEYCQPDILHFNQSILPVIFQTLDDPRPTLQGTSCYVLEYFCENLQPSTLRPYLPLLMGKLATLLQSTQRSTKEMALTAIAATAVASEKDFLPYSEVICQILGELIFNTEPDLFAIRGRALECLGHVAVALGREHFSRYFEAGMRSAMQAVQLGDESLKEHSYVFIANCAKVMGKAYVPFLPELVPFLLGVVEESEVTIHQEGDEDVEEDDDEEDDEDEDGDEEEGDYRLNVQEGFINSKKAALTAIGALAENTLEAFAPYLQKTLQVLMTPETGVLFSLHDVIRAEALSILQFLLLSACRAEGVLTEAASEAVSGSVLSLTAGVVEVGAAVMQAYLTAMNTDRDLVPISYACEGVSGVLRSLGLAALGLPLRPITDSNKATNNAAAEETGPLLNKLMETVHNLLQEKSPAQKLAKKMELQHLAVGGTGGGDADDEEEEDHDNVVIDSVTDLVGELAKVMKAEFVPYFRVFHKALLKFTKPSRPHSDRAMAIGCYAEVLAELGGAAVMEYAEVLLPVVRVGCTDTMESVRRNSAFCLGVFVESTGPALSGYFLQMLTWLHPLCVRPAGQQVVGGGADVGGADVDNALSAVAKMIRVAPAGLIPLDQVLPVLLEALPLRGDTSEVSQ